MKTTSDQNKIGMLFNRRDYEAAARYWSRTYMQRSAHIGGEEEVL
jgi:hypothetical protein